MFKPAKWMYFFLLTGITIFPNPKILAKDLSAFKSRTTYENIDVQSIQQWDSYEQVNQYFLLVRDTRFIEDPKIKGTYRRISWMLPDFGCNARAALAIEYLKKFKNLLLPNKLFIFVDHKVGPLLIETNFSPEGDVEWMEHVALVVRVKNQVYVLDPSIELSRPLELDQWISVMTNDKRSLSFSVCDSDTFEPADDCNHPKIDLKNALKQQNTCLVLERRRVKKLGLDPDLVLGDEPPWSK